jgi:tetratricopeptide (TPR) repeat protein
MGNRKRYSPLKTFFHPSLQKQFYTLLWLLLPAFAFSQKSIFAYVNNESGKEATTQVDSRMFATVQTIYDKLVQARGDVRQVAPKLVIRDAEKYVAWMDPKAFEIGIEKRALDICFQFGPDSLNAIAALLAHELTHFYEKHDWSSHYIHQATEQDTSLMRQRMLIAEQQETQADGQGGFLAFSAGYDVYDILPKLLPRIYADYALNKELPGYPSLEERIEQSKLAAQQLLELQTVFETANYLSLLEEYDKANTYFNYLLRKFPSREMHSNSGVNEVLQAISLFSTAEMPFILPIEPDPNSRLHNRKNVVEDRIEKRTRLLKSSISHFDAALQLDPDYGKAMLYKACAYTLLQSWRDADYWLFKAESADGSLATACAVLQAIQLAMKSQVDEATQLLKKEEVAQTALGQINYQILTDAPLTTTANPDRVGREKIDQLVLPDFLEEPSVDTEVILGHGVTCGKKDFPNSTVYVHYADNGFEYLLLHVTKPGATDPSYLNIKAGDSLDKIRATYGPPARIVSNAGGIFLLYPKYELIFEVNQQNTLRTWGHYIKS